MQTTLRKIGNSKGVIIPAALLAQAGLDDAVDLRLDGNRIIIEPVKTPREGWFNSADPIHDVDVWEELPPDGDASEWEW
jgi:antitoxin MazE